MMGVPALEVRTALHEIVLSGAACTSDPKKYDAAGTGITGRNGAVGG